MTLNHELNANNEGLKFNLAVLVFRIFCSMYYNDIYWSETNQEQHVWTRFVTKFSLFSSEPDNWAIWLINVTCGAGTHACEQVKH